jgi:hypothetical protein
VFDWPGEIRGVLLPLQVFAWMLPRLLEQTLKSCGRLPPFVTLNETIPRFSEDFESLNLNSFAFVTVTVTFWMIAACPAFAPAVGSTVSEARAAAAPIETRNLLNECSFRGGLHFAP